MSSTSQVSGLVSGLDTASIISALMSVEKIPQSQLTDRKTDLTSLVSALQSLNVKTQSLAETAKTAAKTSSWSALTATSTADSVTASAGSTASATSLSFTVGQVAQSQVSLTGTFTDIAAITGGGSTMSLKLGDTVTEIDVSGITTAADLAQAISSSDAGVGAAVVRSTDTNGDPIYRLQLTGRETGEDQSFTLYQGDAAAVEAETAPAVALTTARTAQDAEITLWPGTAAEQTVTSSSNTFSDLVTGLDVTVTATEDAPVTIDVTPDTDALKKLGSDLVGQLNVVLSEITSRTKSSTTTDEEGRTVVKGGVLSGNLTVRALSEGLLEAGSYDVDGVSPSTIGITVDSDGTFAFNEETFANALASDPEQVQEMLTSIANKVDSQATLASDKYTGSITSQITDDNNQITDLSDRILRWDSVLEARQASLETQWANLETTLQALNSQSSWLTSIIGSLSTSTTSSS